MKAKFRYNLNITVVSPANPEVNMLQHSFKRDEIVEVISIQGRANDPKCRIKTNDDKTALVSSCHLTFIRETECEQ